MKEEEKRVKEEKRRKKAEEGRLKEEERKNVSVLIFTFYKIIRFIL